MHGFALVGAVSRESLGWPGDESKLSKLLANLPHGLLFSFPACMEGVCLVLF